jgi:hypothetical protein
LGEGSDHEDHESASSVGSTNFLNEQFLRIVAEGTGKIFKPEDNRSWETVTRPILEAFFHAHYFLEMA